MKKLMTLVSAVALAVGLRAADTGTSFEGMSAGDLDITSSTDELAAGTSGYWVTNGSDTVSLTVTAGTSLVRESTLTIPQFAEEDQDYYLNVKSSFGNPVTRKIKTGNSGQLIGNDGFYFDSLVKFTAFDEDPMTTAVTNDFDGAKIAVWAREVYVGDVVQSTNLYVRAGYLGGEPQTYDCGQMLNPGAWKRLTIKAIKNIYVSGENDVPAFVVFIDGNAVGAAVEKGIVAANLNDKYEGFNNSGALFPSLAQTGDDSDVMLSSVSFDGQGGVDDIVFTETAPSFAKDAEYVYINWTAADIAALTIDSVALTSEQLAAGSYKVAYADDLTVSVTATYADGKLAGTWTTTGSATIEDGTFSFTEGGEIGTIVAANAAASFNGTPYATLQDAVAAANATAVPQLPAPVLKLFGTTSADDIAIEAAGSDVSITIDLNGQTVGAITGLSPLSIVDPVGGGVVAGEVYFDVYGSIDAGTYNAAVSFGDTGAIAGGQFLASENTASALNPFAPQGYEFVEEEGYLVLAEKAPEFAFAVTAGDNSYVSEVLIGGDDVTTAVTNGTLAVITSNVAWSVTFTANDGYEFEGGLSATNFTGTAEAAVAVTGPNATASSGDEPTIEPGETSIDNVQASSAADATNKVVVASPDASIVTDEDYKKYFTLTATATGENTYTVSIEINKEAIELPETLEDVGGDLQDAAAAFGEDEDAAFTGVSAKPGLWYWIVTATDPAFSANVTPGTAVQAEGATVDLEAVKPANVVNGVFFKVCVDTVAPVAP